MHVKTNMVSAVVGPTGSGKTALAVKLAQEFKGVLISADSRQVYRGLNIGTNKEGAIGDWQGHSARFIDGVPQLLIDIADPGELFNLNDWLEQARALLPKIWGNGQLPIVVGGTGLYVSALTEGYQPGNGRYAKNNQPVNFESLILQPDVEREILYQRSDQRFQRILDDLLVEIRQLLADGVTPEWLEKIGLDYRFAVKQIMGQLSREETIKQYQGASRAYIRRQLTWWRHHGHPQKITSTDEAIKLVETLLG